MFARTLKRFMLLIGVCALFMAGVYSFTQAVQTRAQGQQLLQNSDLSQYYGTGQGDSVVPFGWELVTTTPIRSAQQKWLFNEHPGFTASWELTGNDKTFTSYGIQFVPGVSAGTKLRFTAFANLYTCNDRTTSCIGSDGKRKSDQASQSRTRVGVDPNGGKDPNSPNIVWSGYISSYDAFGQMTVDIEAKGGNGVTVFLNMTQALGLAINSVYWDKPSLVTLSPGDPITNPGGATATPVVRLAPFVTPQGQQPDGSIVHTVGEGDTLSSIAVAYGVTVTQIRQLNGIPDGEYVIRPGQKLTIKTPPAPVTYVIVTATYTPGGPTETPITTPTFTPTFSGTRMPFVTLATLVSGQ